MDWHLRSLGLDAKPANAANQVVAGALGSWDGNYFDGMSGIMRPQDQAVACEFHISDCADAFRFNCVQIRLAFTVGFQGSVMTVYEHQRSGKEPGIHGGAVLRLYANDDEALP